MLKLFTWKIYTDLSLEKEETKGLFFEEKHIVSKKFFEE